MNMHVAIIGDLGGARAASDRSGARTMSRALSVAAWALLETFARFALVSLLLVTLAIRLALFAVLLIATPRAAPDLSAAGLDRFADPLPAPARSAMSEVHRR